MPFPAKAVGGTASSLTGTAGGNLSEGLDDALKSAAALLNEIKRANNFMKIGKALNGSEELLMFGITFPGDTVQCPTCNSAIIQDSSGTNVHPGETVEVSDPSVYPKYNPNKKE